ncbi:chromosome segregation protein SMC [Haloarchaeobius sp. DFWS5]|uniref:chromosome segregation protein SMC n=1 Tax=Haloarchaeobius sp. DFWS5 TaxID=3446114 RepID=UPI003EB702B6
MHIKELVLDNFKSFGRKTRIPFYEDFTVVTGPNGSGKSNIIDAVLFALGLARTRGIRAEKLTDLIYNPGHDDGERDGATREAIVEVILDNTDRTLERTQIVNAAGSDDVGDVDEVRIKRRVKQTEDNYYSYYYLNGRSVNLSDIQDLLAQAGVTPEGYNVVMQGDVTEIINMTPFSRREIIDEIAGVAEFDAKKDAALEELEVVEERINEAELRISEKRGRLGQLEDERQQALRYRRLRREKETYEGYLKAAELEEKREDLASTEDRRESKQAELDDLHRDLDQKQGTVVRLQEDLEDLNAEIERKGEDEQLEIKRDIESLKGDVARFEDKIEASEEAIQEAENKRRDAFVQIDRKQEEVDDLASEIRETKVQKSSLKADVATKQGELAELQAEIDEIDTEYDELKADLQSKKAELEEAKDEKNELQREKDRLLDEARRRSNETSEIADDIEEAKASKPDLEADISDLEDELEKARRNVLNIEGVLDDLKAEKQELQGDLQQVEDKLRKAQSEYAELEAQAGQSGDSSFGRAVTTTLNSGINGVHGAVAQLGSVDPKFATACETAAGGRMANVVVRDDVIGQQCIEHLKSRNAGRATFLPMNKMRDRSLPSAPDAPGVVDFAYNLIDFESQYAGIFSHVVGDTLVVDTLDTARDMQGKYRLVTLDGDLVEKSGAMTGGSSKGSRYSFDASGEGQLKRVAERISDLEDERQSLQNDVQSVDSRLDDARDRKTEATDAVRSIESDIESKQAELDSIDERVADLEARREELDAERESVDDEMQEIESDLGEYKAQISDLEAEVADIEGDLADSDIPELTAKMDEKKEEIDRIEDRMDDLDASLNELQLEKQYAEESIEDLHDDIETAQNKKADHEERITGFEESIEEKEEELEGKRRKVLELENELSELKEERTSLKADLKEAEAARDSVQKQVDAVESKLSSMAEAVEQLQWEIESLEAEVGDYDPDEIPDHDEVVRMTAAFEEDMTAMEPVNMKAIDDYDAVKSDLDELVSGRDTLAEEADGIRERIESYESQKKETFMESFEAIDENFQEIFSRLSAGSGHLHLEDEADPFDGGLTMKAQPGDKPIQRLDAMSGGEKSLTALAFIFAIQRHNPAPFYALDEVDAFLDAVNAERVGQMVDELAGRAQFVVVSHRTAMLDRSERAIGVTMQQNNVSAVTGIDLSDGSGEVEEEVPADD